MYTELLRKEFYHNFFHTKVGVEMPDSERIVFHNYDQLRNELPRDSLMMEGGLSCCDDLTSPVSGNIHLMSWANMTGEAGGAGMAVLTAAEPPRGS